MSKSSKTMSFFLTLISASIKGVIVSIILVLGLAFLLKFVKMSNNLITIFDQIIKIISIFVAVKSMLKNSPNKTLVKSFFVGIVYTILTFILFSALNGNYAFSVGTILDALLGGVIGVILAVILNIFSREKIKV